MSKDFERPNLSGLSEFPAAQVLPLMLKDKVPDANAICR